ncbi:hypothetical protein GDO86_015136 [Hymenochirus boettgeri]|uniref:Uncharacterized protein n=1 Tax=Hymenochirus boettgeri TaxID=247094 RepID=A0A8T2JWN6_9PIPI|nr:hypothetical protein GDO86_015136 [Hymenochirus boettgeri]
MKPPIPPQCRVSQELWMWAKCQVLSSLRLPFGIGPVLPALKKASNGRKEGSCSILPCKTNGPVKYSRTHQELHRELLLTYKKGLVLHSKPELLQVLEKRRSQWKDGKKPELESTPLERELQKWQQRRVEKEQKSTKDEVPAVHEFLRVRENLRKSATRDAQSPPPSIS